MSIFYQTRYEEFHSFISNNNSYPPHLHKQSEIAIVLSGCIEFNISGKTYILSEGDISLIFPDVIHSTNTDSSSRVLFILFNPEFIPDFNHLFKEQFIKEPVINKAFLSLYSAQAIDGLLKFTSEKEESGTSDNISLCMQKGMLTILISDIFSHSEFTVSSAFSDTNISRQLIQYLDNHITEELSLAKTAKALGVSKYYLSHIFSDKLKISFTDYLAIKRLDIAKKLLSGTDIPVTDIAFESGFSSTRSFYRRFKEHFGITPDKYRKTH